ncbi:MAG: type 3 dihydrofolate reductase [Porticoccaceae bacterium]
MKIALVVAVSQNNVIGRDNQLPWHLPEDLQYFKSVTMGKPILMGRKTFDSIGRPLPGRKNIVITRDLEWDAEGVEVVHGVDDALAAGADACAVANSDEIMIIGGAQIYRDCLPIADRLYLTRVEAEIEGDAFFPDIDIKQWQKIAEKTPKEIDKYSYCFQVLERTQI